MSFTSLRLLAAGTLAALAICAPATALAQAAAVPPRCASIFSASGAVPGTAACYWTAYASHVNLSNYECISDATLKAYCGVSPKLVGVFNGVWNSREDAEGLRNRIERELGSTYHDAPLEYDLFYNQTSCKTPGAIDASCLEDIAETFAQRTAALDEALSKRWEMFWEMVGGRYRAQDSVTLKLITGVGALADLGGLMDGLLVVFTNSIVNGAVSLVTHPPTATDADTHLAQLRQWFSSSKVSGAMLVAHSQGNLFANAVYDGFKAEAPLAKLSMVHVAPASPSLHGGYALADIDLVINGLRATGIPVPANNLVLPLSAEDASGHQFQATYLDVARAGYAEVRQLMFTALNSLF